MNDKEPKQVIQEELQKLAGMSWGQRLGYIWDYYKPLMAALLAVIFLISVGVEIYHNKQIEHLLNVQLIDNGNPLGDTDAMTAEFVEMIGGLEEKQQITIDASLVLGDETDPNLTANQTKFTVLAAANELEILLLDEDAFEYYCNQSFFADLSSMLTEEQQNEWSQLLVHRDKIEDVNESETEASEAEQNETAAEGTEKIIAAIDLTDSPVLQNYGFYPNEKVYGCVFVNAEYKELYGQFFTFLLK